MRALFKTLPILVFAGALSISCGKDGNQSGTSSSSTGGISGLPGNTVTQSQAYSSIEQVRSAFAQKSLSDGLSTTSSIYHVGPYFNNSYGSSSGGIDFQADFCINLFGWSAGNCDDYGSYGQNIENMLLDQLDNGVYKKVVSATSTSVSYQKPTEVVQDNYGGWSYGYTNAQTESFQRSSDLYRKMLGLDIPAQNILDSKVSAATITMSDGQQVVGQVVELFIGSSFNGNSNVSEVRRYVVSTNLPLLANPVAVVGNIYQSYSGYTASVSGYLAYLGNTTSSGAVKAVQSIKINKLHYPQYNFGSFQLQPVQNVTIGF